MVIFVVFVRIENHDDEFNLGMMLIRKCSVFGEIAAREPIFAEQNIEDIFRYFQRMYPTRRIIHYWKVRGVEVSTRIMFGI